MSNAITGLDGQLGLLGAAFKAIDDALQGRQVDIASIGTTLLGAGLTTVGNFGSNVFPLASSGLTPGQAIAQMPNIGQGQGMNIG